MGRTRKSFAVTRHAMMLGRLTDGAERDHGSYVHALYKAEVFSPRIPDMLITVEKSICGKKPGKRSVGWSDNDNDNDKPITCPKCLKRLEK